MAKMKRYLFHTDGGELCLSLKGLSIARCVVDVAGFALQAFARDGTIELRIETPFVLADLGPTLELDPTVPKSLGPAFALLGATVTSAKVSAEGRLALAFNDRRAMAIAPSERFEAWQLIGPRGIKVVCRAGGGVSIWGETGGDD